VAFFANIIGLILGIVALVQSRKAGYKNTPAVWAIIVGAVLAVLGVILLVVLIGVFAAGAGELLQQCADLGPGEWTLDNGVTITCN
jgi:ABC-type methionine transport system permease subunit